MQSAEIVKLLDMYQAKADRAHRAYQETGTQAYQWRGNRYEDIADVCRLALDGNDERQRMADTLATCRQVLSQYPAPDPAETIKMLRRVLKLREEE